MVIVSMHHPIHSRTFHITAHIFLAIWTIVLHQSRTTTALSTRSLTEGSYANIRATLRYKEKQFRANKNSNNRIFTARFLSVDNNSNKNEAEVFVGRRKIQCTRVDPGYEINGVDIVNGSNAATVPAVVMTPKYVLPILLGYIGAQAGLPGIGKCPVSAQIQPPWFNGGSGGGGAGFCPVEYWVFAPLVTGFVFILVAIWLSSYARDQRLLIDASGLKIVQVQTTKASDDRVLLKDPGTDNENSKKSRQMILFENIEDWNMTPIGLTIKRSDDSGSTNIFFPLFWDAKSVEALLNDRIDA